MTDAHNTKQYTHLTLAVDAHVQTAWSTARSVLNLWGQLYYNGLLQCYRFASRTSAASQGTGLAVILVSPPYQYLSFIRYVIVCRALLFPKFPWLRAWLQYAQQTQFFFNTLIRTSRQIVISLRRNNCYLTGVVEKIIRSWTVHDTLRINSQTDNN